MRTIIKLALSAGLIWWLYDRYRNEFTVDTEKPLPPGAKPSGRVAMTTGGGPPGEDVSGFHPKAFAEIILPTGERIWTAIKQNLSKTFAGPAGGK